MTSRLSTLAESLSHTVGLDAPGDDRIHPDHDPDAPRDVHDSHRWSVYDRWSECDVCATRDYWPGASRTCAGRDARKGGPALSIVDWIRLLEIEVGLFAEWWAAKNLGDSRPDAAEWHAEYSEWRRYRGGAV